MSLRSLRGEAYRRRITNMARSVGIADGAPAGARKTARTAGVLYLLSGLSGVFSYVYLPTQFIVPSDGVATAARITARPVVYNMGIVSDVAGQILLVCAVLQLYALLRDVNRARARLMVVFVVLAAAVQFANAFNLLAPTILLGGMSYLTPFTTAQADALALAFLRLRETGMLVTQVFWGLWLLPLGLLVIASGFVPRVLGMALVVASVGYVAASAAYFMMPVHGHIVTHFAMPIGGVAETAMILWLIVKGVRTNSLIAG
jgi:hypothetical protein